MTDLINHPPHYTNHPSGVEAIDCTEQMGYSLGCAAKYLWRCDEKGAPIADVEKALWYVKRERARRTNRPESAGALVVKYCEHEESKFKRETMRALWDAVHNGDPMLLEQCEKAIVEEIERRKAEAAETTERDVSVEYIDSGAKFDQFDKRYRWTLWRKWNESGRHITFVMLNPSTADAVNPDPTITRCIGFAREHGYGELTILNLFPFRSPWPSDVHTWYKSMRQNDPRGLARLQDATLIECEFAGAKGDVVVGWGNHGRRFPLEVRAIIGTLSKATMNVYHIGDLTKYGQPRHPLYLPADSLWNHFPHTLRRPDPLSAIA